MDHVLPELIDELVTHWPRRYSADTVRVVEVAEMPTPSDIRSWKKDSVIVFTYRKEIATRLVLDSFQHRQFNGMTALWWV